MLDSRQRTKVLIGLRIAHGDTPVGAEGQHARNARILYPGAPRAGMPPNVTNFYNGDTSRSHNDPGNTTGSYAFSCL